MRKRLCWGLDGGMTLSAIILGGCSAGMEKVTAESIWNQVGKEQKGFRVCMVKRWNMNIWLLVSIIKYSEDAGIH